MNAPDKPPELHAHRDCLMADTLMVAMLGALAMMARTDKDFETLNRYRQALRRLNGME
jgi:hypothetical protein